MKNQTQKTAPASPKARRKTQPKRQLAARLLTVTLDAIASAAVRRFAEEFGEDVRDVASGSILDTLPQALEEWQETKTRRATGKGAVLDYWQGTEEMVRDARKRRIASEAGKEAA
jgi:pyruvate/2-oxoglutarate dehydrogenase complex dihydrolipoamide acyltransferase (E2) component